MKRTLGILTLLLTGGFFIFSKTSDAVEMPAVIINELLWMGSSTSSNDEWIELRNTTSTAIDLANWRLTKLSNNIEVPMLTIPAGIIPPGGFFIVSNDAAATSRLAVEPQLVDASVSLVNSKLQITLYDAAAVLVDRADDGTGSPLSGEYQSGAVWKSMERNPAGVDGTQKESWHAASASAGFDDAEKEFGTPGSENSNQAPVISAVIPADAVAGESVNLDASETMDPEGDAYTIEWRFGDGAVASGITAQHTYTSAGSYDVTLTADDGKAVSTFSSTIVVASSVPATTEPTPQKPSQTPQGTAPNGAPPRSDAPEAFQTSKAIRLNELLPNPSGRDGDGEFIELFNEGTTSVDLRGWKITDRDHSFSFSSSVVLDPQHLLALTTAETKLSLKNSGKNEWYLVDPFGAIQHGVAYEGAPEGKSFSRVGDRWAWTTPTPGKENQKEKKYGEEGTETDTHEEDLALVSLSDIRRRALRSEVRIRATVIVAPGTVGANFFYVSDKKTGIQIFSSKGAFADLTPGDIIEIRGKIGEANGERKLNVQTEDDIVVVDSGELPDPVAYTKTLAGGVLALVQGVLTGKRGAASLTLETPDGAVTVTFPRNAQIDKSRFTVGDALTVSGLWRVTKDGGRLYPLSDEDIESQGSVKAAETGVTQEAPIATVSRPQTIALSTSDAKGSLAKALLPPLLVLGCIGGFMLRKKWKASRTERED